MPILIPDFSSVAVRAGDTAGGDLAGTYPNPTIASLAVTTGKLNDHAVTPPKLQTGLSGLLTLFDSTLGANAASIDTGANGVGQSADHLLIEFMLRTTEAVVFSTVYLRFNADSGANYDWGYVQGVGTISSAGAFAADTGLQISAYGSTAPANVPAIGRADVPGYRQTTFSKVALVALGGADGVGGDTNASQRVVRWRNTAAITQVALVASSGNIVAGSRLTIYGIAV